MGDFGAKKYSPPSSVTADSKLKVFVPASFVAPPLRPPLRLVAVLADQRVVAGVPLEEDAGGEVLVVDPGALDELELVLDILLEAHEEQPARCPGVRVGRRAVGDARQGPAVGDAPADDPPPPFRLEGGERRGAPRVRLADVGVGGAPHPIRVLPR